MRSTPGAEAENLFLGRSAIMLAVRDHICRAARIPRWPLRLEGPRGSGKNAAAKLFHAASKRPGPLVSCPAGVISASEGRELGELVGWVRGAFTGADRDHCGAFEYAHHGTLFLNEIHLASPRVQQILLDFLDDRTFKRLGNQSPIQVDVAVVFATNTDLNELVRQGVFREDLIDRMSKDIVELPPLWLHMEDLPELASHLATKLAREAAIEPRILRPDELDRLMCYEWPGNVRELEDALQTWYKYDTLPSWLPSRRQPHACWQPSIQGLLKQFKGNKSAVARALRMSRKTLYARIRQNAPETFTTVRRPKVTTR